MIFLAGGLCGATKWWATWGVSRDEGWKCMDVKFGIKHVVNPFERDSAFFCIVQKWADTVFWSGYRMQRPVWQIREISCRNYPDHWHGCESSYTISCRGFLCYSNLETEITITASSTVWWTTLYSWSASLLQSMHVSVYMSRAMFMGDHISTWVFYQHIRLKQNPSTSLTDMGTIFEIYLRSV